MRESLDRTLQIAVEFAAPRQLDAQPDDARRADVRGFARVEVAQRAGDARLEILDARPRVDRDSDALPAQRRECEVLRLDELAPCIRQEPRPVNARLRRIECRQRTQESHRDPARVRAREGRPVHVTEQPSVGAQRREPRTREARVVAVRRVEGAV